MSAGAPPRTAAGVAGVANSAPSVGQRLAHRRQVAGAVVDERNHSSPFVLGSIFARRASFAHATRSARANALNTASMWWWLERPYSTLTWTLARAPDREAVEEVVHELGLQVADHAHLHLQIDDGVRAGR
mgnify:CR=1 FL=1